MKIGVIGSGSWGSALALTAQRAGNNVTIWSRNEAIANEINRQHTNKLYLQDIKLPEDLIATNDLSSMINNDILLLVVPAQTMREICHALEQKNLPKQVTLVICAKGIEQNSFKLMSEVVKEFFPLNPIAILSGPNFAYEVAQNLPAIASIASAENAELLAKMLSSKHFRFYPNNDVIGVQIIGAAKNVLAIATGITIGNKMGENSKSAILSCGINEINALSIAKGGDAKTMLTPAGIGDINLTCNSLTSRNTAYGIALAKNKTNNGHLIEGFFTAKSIFHLSQNLEIDMPIFKAVYQIIYQNYSINSIIKFLNNS
jgi:glycerol-3-phosphate dehydrogenase (NAD(P)+)